MLYLFSISSLYTVHIVYHSFVLPYLCLNFVGFAISRPFVCLLFRFVFECVICRSLLLSIVLIVSIIVVVILVAVSTRVLSLGSLVSVVGLCLGLLLIWLEAIQHIMLLILIVIQSVANFVSALKLIFSSGCIFVTEFVEFS